MRWLSLFFLVLSVTAEAQERPWYVGMPISQVSLEAPEGGLPAENLEPLLKSQQGGMISALSVRDDLAMLYGTGLFAEVEATVRPWVGFDADGEPRDEVWLVYRVIAATVLSDWSFSGNTHFSSRELALAGGIALGDRFLEEEDASPLEALLERAYAQRGYPAADVNVRALGTAKGEVRLEVTIEEGPPRILESLVLADSPALAGWRMRRILLRAGLEEGEPFTQERMEAGRQAIELAHRERGWLEARVNAVLGRQSVREVVFLIEAGPKVTWTSEVSDVSAEELPGLFGVSSRDRLRASDLEDGQELFEQKLRSEGWSEAVVSLDVREEAQTKEIVVRTDRGPEYRLQELRFEGAAAFEPSFLEEAVEEAAAGTLGEGRVTRDASFVAKEALLDLYEAKGHLHVAIEPVLTEVSRDAEGVEHLLVFDIDEGPLVRLADLRFSGLVEDLEGVAGSISERFVGQVVDQGAMESAVADLVEAHRELGHLEAGARVRWLMERSGDTAVAEVRVDPGEPVYLRYVLVRGNRKTLRRLIEDSVLLTVGEPVSPSLLGETRRRLYDLGVFTSVELRLEGEEAQARDLVVQVREKAGLAVEVGGGVATDLGVRAFSRLVRRNLFGVGHKVTVLGELGVGYEGEAWRLDTTAPEWRAALRYDAPRFPSPSVASHVDLLLNEREQEPTYRLGRSGGAFGVQIGGVEQGFQLAVGYRFFGHWLQDVDPGAIVIGDPWVEVLDVGSVEEIAGALPGGPRWESGPTLLAIWDGRDDRFNPKSGNLFSVQMDLTDPGVADQITARAEGQLQTIVPLGPLSLQFAAGGGVGWAQGRSTTLALEKRFRMGGANSLRGFALDTVGPKNRVAISDLPWPDQLAPVVDELYRDSPVRWVPTGGDSMARFSLEVWAPLETFRIPASGTSLVAFVDAGNVFFTDPTILATSIVVDPEPILRVGTGLGLRIATPVGPVQVDFGLNPSYYTASWAEERGEEPWRFHLSLGSL